jgi:hypothetical protein
MANEFSQAQFNMLLKMAGKKLGTDPETLRKALESGNADMLLKQAKGQNDQLKQVLSNPELASKLMDSPQAKELLKKLMGG